MQSPSNPCLQPIPPWRNGWAARSKHRREYCIVRALDADNPAAVALYLKYGTNPNHLHRALFRERSIAVIQLLVQHGADVSSRY
jgi:hypothetical protein